jgi:hypothetical protein
MLSTMTIQTAAQKAPRSIDPKNDTKKHDVETTRTREDDRETMLDDDLYANLAHTD